MFGYVTADLSLLDEGQRLRYQGCYCGLCHALRREGSPLCRLAVNFDMVSMTGRRPRVRPAVLPIRLKGSSIFKPAGAGTARQ